MWNAVFCMDKKNKSKSKNYRRIEIHLIVPLNIDNENSPDLSIKCESCNKNIKKSKE